LLKALLGGAFILSGCSPQHESEMNPGRTTIFIVRSGRIYDGSGAASYVADIGVNADTIAFIGDLKRAHSKKEITRRDCGRSRLHQHA